MIKRALISVYNKKGLQQFANRLVDICEDIEIISSGGTAEALRGSQSVKKYVVDVSSYTGFPESPGGLVKTLHPKIYAGLLLNNPNIPEYVQYLEENGIKPIDLVVANLYPFEETVAKPDITLDKAVEQIDIGGHAMIRAGVKGSLLHGTVTVVVDPNDYATVIGELERHHKVRPGVKRRLAKKAFDRTTRYDIAIDNYLRRISETQLDDFPSERIHDSFTFV